MVTYTKNTREIIYNTQMNEFGFYFVADELSLDFSNTLIGSPTAITNTDFLENPKRLHDWYISANLMTANDSRESAFKSALELRSTLHEMYRNLQGNNSIANTTLEKFNGFLEQRRERLQIRSEGISFVLECLIENQPDPVFQIAESAAYFLANLERNRLKKCSNPNCNFLFYDRSKNNSRRWCDMQTCGNRAKQTRFRLENEA